jgi:hypothetical protein
MLGVDDGWAEEVGLQKWDETSKMNFLKLISYLGKAVDVFRAEVYEVWTDLKRISCFQFECNSFPTIRLHNVLLPTPMAPFSFSGPLSPSTLTVPTTGAGDDFRRSALSLLTDALIFSEVDGPPRFAVAVNGRWLGRFWGFLEIQELLSTVVCHPLNKIRGNFGSVIRIYLEYRKYLTLKSEWIPCLWAWSLWVWHGKIILSPVEVLPLLRLHYYQGSCAIKCKKNIFKNCCAYSSAKISLRAN